ncbi:MAG TPA: hypothetical protein VJT49_30420 [Amycolatopsis sp.]|uniref:hypothetical protein n=1 Tax=Amycolatopsis sp. TaxID=37632 RepID=UPI002B47F2DA|nr:hypothetical protein [Amycolatopsis sp.]HKS49349.1 hypothetical protein [Amycolatopsis sp.]
MSEAAFHVLSHALTQCQADRVTGTLRLIGGPGGVVQLNNGAVTSVESPGAPGAAVLSTRAGKVDEADWIAGLCADGAFAIAMGGVRECAVDREPARPPRRGLDPGWLLRETSRRLEVLTSLSCAVSPYRERVVRMTGRQPGVLPTFWREILVHANGRRTASNLAFMVRRGLYVVTVEISEMLGKDLLKIAPDAFPDAVAGSPAPLPRRRPGAGRPGFPR